MTKNEKHKYEITKEGSLGLLALGDLGIEAWRKMKKQIQQNEIEKK